MNAMKIQRLSLLPTTVGVFGALELAVTFAVLGAGCSSQAAGDYRGEPLARIEGTLVTGDATPPEDGADVALVWDVFAGNGDRVVGESVSVTGDFPASFGLDLYAPPAAEALNDFTRGGRYADEAKIGTAYILAIRTGSLDALMADPDDQSESILGVVEDYVLVYADRDVAEGSRTASFLHGALTRGYHLMRVERPTEEERDAQEECEDEILACWSACVDSAETQEEIDSCDASCGSEEEVCGGFLFDQLYEAEGSPTVTLRLGLAEGADDMNWPNFT